MLEEENIYDISLSNSGYTQLLARRQYDSIAASKNAMHCEYHFINIVITNAIGPSTAVSANERIILKVPILNAWGNSLNALQRHQLLRYDAIR